MNYLSVYLRQFQLLYLMLSVPLFLNAQHTGMGHSASAEKNIFLTMMDTMMTAMDTAPKEGSIDIDFIREMTAHHQGAVDMANHEIKYGKDFSTVQLAKSILMEQTSEIQQMKIWMKQLSLNSEKIDNDFQHQFDKSMQVMMRTMPSSDMLSNTDNSFCMVMIPHHQAAIDMAKTVIQFSKNQQLVSFATHLISAEQIEIEQMSAFLKQ